MITPKIERKNLSAVVAQHLQEQIEAGTWSVGQQLPSEHEMTREYGVGRSSIREAIRKLENNGLVRVHQGVGTFVVSDKPVRDTLSTLLHGAEDKELHEVRELLEIKIAERAALHRTEEDIRIMKACLEKRDKASGGGELAPWVEADIAFHISIAEASRNKVLANLYRVFAQQDIRKHNEKIYSRNESLPKRTTLHSQLLESIVNRQPGKAVEITWKLNRQ